MGLGATASSSLPVNYTSNTTAICTISGSNAVLVAVGNCSITANQAGNASFVAAGPVTRTFNVTQNANVITFTAPPDTALSAGPVGLGATASSALTVSYTSNTAAICTISGSNAVLVAVGSCSITANQAGNGSFVAATPVTRTFNVTQNANVITFTAPPDTALSAGPVGLGATASSSLPVNYTSNTTAICTISGSAAVLVAVGSCSITANQAGNASFVAATPVTRTFNVTQNANVITFTALADTALSAGSVALGATASSALTVSYTSNTTAICTIGGSNAVLVAVGSCSITANQVGKVSLQPHPLPEHST